MKKTTIALVVAVAGFAAVAQAAPKDNTWYTGGKIGWSQYHDTGFYQSSGLKVSNSNTKPDQLAAGAYVGFQANPYVGFELGYDWLGRMQYRANDDGQGAALKTHGIQLAAKFGYPVTNDIDIYTRLGGMVWRTDVKTDGGFKDHDTGISPLAAIGVEYAITPSVATRLDYQYVHHIGDGDSIGTRPDNTTLSLGLAYRFGQNAQPAPVVAPTTTKFELKSDVLFGFDKANIKDEGKVELDQLYSQLNNIAATDGQIVVTGHTDRIGNAAYNQKLSEKRAQSVVDYLVNKGIPSDRISAAGVGAAQPVTGDTCNTIKQRNAKIACFAPDRRVEVEITGLREVK